MLRQDRLFLLAKSMEQSGSWKSYSRSFSQEIPSIYETRQFTTVFTKTHHNPTSRAKYIHSPNPPTLRL